MKTAEEFLKAKGLDFGKKVTQNIGGEFFAEIPLIEWMGEFATERDAEIKALVDEMIEEAKKDDFAHKQTGMLYCDKTMGKIQALTELKEKL